MDFQSYLNSKKPLLLDGALGTLLQFRGYELPSPQWSAAILESQPEVITSIHREYLKAGAEVITTATFRTTSRVYSQLGKSEIAKDLNFRAVQCARDAIGKGNNQFIAGSVAPLEDCYRPDLVPENNQLYSEHREQIGWLIEAGVDVLLFETMNSVEEAAICSEIAAEFQFPFFTSVVCDAPGQLLIGEPVTSVVDAIVEYNPLGILVNCTHPETLKKSLNILNGYTSIPIGGYANVGKSQPVQTGVIDEVNSPAEYAGFVQQWLRFNVNIIGGCCGTTPEHIQALYKLIKLP